ncbi:hypothetical protein Acidovoranil_17130 [Acidovorax sp. FG27]
MAWVADHLGARQGPEKRRHANPRPAGVIRPGSGTDVLLRFLQRSPGRWFFHAELVLALGRSKGEVDWALIYLARSGLIFAEEIDLPRRRAVHRYLCATSKH